MQSEYKLGDSVPEFSFSFQLCKEEMFKSSKSCNCSCYSLLWGIMTGQPITGIPGPRGGYMAHISEDTESKGRPQSSQRHHGSYRKESAF